MTNISISNQSSSLKRYKSSIFSQYINVTDSSPNFTRFCIILLLLHMCIIIYRAMLNQSSVSQETTFINEWELKRQNDSIVNVLEFIKYNQRNDISKEEAEMEMRADVKATSKEQTRQNTNYSKGDEINKDEDMYYYYYYEQKSSNDVSNQSIVKGKRIPNLHNSTPRTGSFRNCTIDNVTSENTSKKTDTHHDSGVVVISCREIWYRAPLAEIERGGVPVVVGILSSASGKGKIHRDSIRSTWAKDRKGIYFLVAGPWEYISEEFTQYHDLIWIDEEEVYEGEHSVLPFKTESFLAIIHAHSRSDEGGYRYLFKTDDDSYVDVVKLENALLHELRSEPLDYWGCCTTRHYAPLRDPALKWHVTYEMYPEEMYPLYCQGAGFATSRSFIKCAVEEHHIRDFRYNPFEDVSIGLLAERCGVQAVTDSRISQFRADEGRKQMLAVDSVESIKRLPKATMEGKILQHRVKTHYDMYSHYICTTHGC